MTSSPVTDGDAARAAVVTAMAIPSCCPSSLMRFWQSSLARSTNRWRNHLGGRGVYLVRGKRAATGARSRAWRASRVRAKRRAMTPTSSASAPAPPSVAPAPRVWLLIGDKLGDNAQVQVLADALGWPYEVRQVF